MTPDKEVDLIMHTSGNYTYTLKSTEITNIPESQPLFIRDNLNGNTYDLRSTEPYDFTSVAGSFTDRFQVIFEDPTLSVETQELDNVLVYTDKANKTLFVKGLKQDAKSLTLTNMLGQTVKSFASLQANELANGIYMGELSQGVYLVSMVDTENNRIDKKIIIE
jgi:hypothetical protein